MLVHSMNGWRTVPVTALFLVSLHAHAAGTCTVAASPTISFGAIDVTLSDQSSNSGSSFWVNCTSEVTAMPGLYSSSARTMTSGSYSLPFSLSLVAPGSADLPASPPGASVALARYNSNETVTLYAKILASDFRTLPAGVYATAITLTLEY